MFTDVEADIYVLADSVMLLGTLLFSVGIVLDSMAHVRREIRRFHYLALSGPAHSRRSNPMGHSARSPDRV